MRIAFNATALLSPLTGIGQYCRHLALGLLNSQDIEANFFYGAFWNKAVRDAPMPGAVKLFPWLRNNMPFSYALRRIVQNHRFAAQAKKQRFDIYHEPNILPLSHDGLTIVTVHDLSWIRYPQAHPVQRIRAMNKYFESGLHRASLILTDSEFVKQELMELCGIESERIRAVPLGVEKLFRPQSSEAIFETLSLYGLVHGQYLLAVGTLEPRKNLQVALRAFSQLAPDIRKRYPLVLVGMKGWLNSELEKQMAPLICAGQVRLLGYVSREQLAAIIAGALTLIYPSIYEGFGLPPLEAMASGVPVIASQAASIPEVVGDTGILIHPHDDKALADAIQQLISSPELREQLARKARARSLRFSWEGCVEQTIDTYRQLLKGKSF